MVAPKKLRGGVSISKTTTLPTQILTSNTETHFWNCKIRRRVPRCHHTGVRKGPGSIKRQQRADKQAQAAAQMQPESNSSAVSMVLTELFS